MITTVFLTLWLARHWLVIGTSINSTGCHWGCTGDDSGDENGEQLEQPANRRDFLALLPFSRNPNSRFALASHSPLFGRKRKKKLRLFCRLKMPIPSSPSKFAGTAVLTISLLSLQGALWYFRPQPTGDVTPLNRYSVVNIHGGYRKLLDFNSSLESEQQLSSDYLDAHGRTSDHRKLVSYRHTVLFD